MVMVVLWPLVALLLAAVDETANSALYQKSMKENVWPVVQALKLRLVHF